MKKITLLSLVSIPLVLCLCSCSSVIAKREVASSGEFSEAYDRKFAENIFFEVKKEIESLDLKSNCSKSLSNVYGFKMSNPTVRYDFEEFYKAINNYSNIIQKLREFGIEFEVYFDQNLRGCTLTPWAMNFNSSTVWVINRINDSLIENLREGRILKGNKIRVVLTDKSAEVVNKINESKSELSYFVYDKEKTGINIFVTTLNPFPGQTWNTNQPVSWAGFYGLMLSEKKGEPVKRPSIVSDPKMLDKIVE